MNQQASAAPYQISPQQGSLAGGYQLTISGTGANHVPTVLFGQVASTQVTLGSAGELSVLVPAVSAAQAVDVSVVLVDGSSLAVGSFTYMAPQLTQIMPCQGGLNGGLKITLTGKYLTGVSAVAFGNVDGLSLTPINDQMLTVVVPNTGSAGPVAVTASVEAVDSNSLSFSYMPPQVSSIAPSAGPLLGGQTVTLRGAYLSGGSAVNFGKLGASDLTLLSDQELTVTVPKAPADEQVNVSAVVQGVSSAPSAQNLYTYSAALSPGVPLVFAASNPADYYLHFIGGVVDGFYYDSTGSKNSLQANTAYPLSALVGSKSVAAQVPDGVPAVLVNSFSGRIYLSRGEPLTGLSSAYTPAAGTSSDPNYQVCYQYFEPTITEGQLYVDLSYIDFTSFALSLTAEQAAHASNPSQLSTTSAELVLATANIAAQGRAQVPEASVANGAVASDFVRVVSPQLAVAGVYPDFSDYLQALAAADAAPIRLRGTYVGTGPQPAASPTQQAQSYDYLVRFTADGSVNLQAQPDSGNGRAAGVPTTQQGTGVGTGASQDLQIALTALTAPTGVYGCNPAYTLAPAAAAPQSFPGITNDIYGQVIGDLLAGLNFGYPGSSQLFNQTPIGQLSSCEWWGGVLPDGTQIAATATPAGQNLYFNSVQPGEATYYNGYAASLAELTAGYGFPLQDRLGKNLLTMNTISDPNAFLAVWVEQSPAAAAIWVGGLPGQNGEPTAAP